MAFRWPEMPDNKDYGVINLIAGGAMVFVGSLGAYAERSFSFSWRFHFNTGVMISLFLATAGALFSLSGLVMLRSSVRVPRSALVLLGIAVLFILIYLVGFMIMHGAKLNIGIVIVNPFVFLPIAVILIALLEFRYFWRRRTR